MSATVQSHRDLIVWQKSMDLAVLVYELTRSFPQSESYGLTSQMRKCAVSIPSNIAEGRRRGTKSDFRHFLLIAFGSGAELETQMEIARRVEYGDATLTERINYLLSEVMRMLNVMIQRLSVTSKQHTR